MLATSAEVFHCWLRVCHSAKQVQNLIQRGKHYALPDHLYLKTTEVHTRISVWLVGFELNYQRFYISLSPRAHLHFLSPVSVPVTKVERYRLFLDLWM